MKMFGSIILQREGFGNISYTEPPGSGSGGAAPLTNADSGTSISPAGTVVLGNQTTSITDATLLDDAVIPLGTFALIISEIGAGVSSLLSPYSALVLQADPGNPLASPEIYVSNGAIEIGRINFTNEAAFNSIFIGRDAGVTYTGGTGGGNIALGDGALANLSTGAHNTAIGAGTLGTSIGAGSDNTAVGYLALQNNTAAGLVNTAVGSQALNKNTTGTRNTAVGFAALNAQTSGNLNTAVGQEAGANLLTGTQNTLVGRDAGLGLNGAQTNNTFVGNEIAVPSGSNCTIVGMNAGGATGVAQAATGSTFVGQGILGSAPVYGNNNTIIGFNNFAAAGQQIGLNNIVLGQTNSSTAGAMVNNNVIIGSNVVLSTGVISGTIVIQNSGAAYNVQIANVVVIGNSAQNTLIGFPSPVVTATNIASQRLQVNGNFGAWHIVGNSSGGAPTATPGSGILTTVLTGTDMAGSITIVTGVSAVPANTVVCTVTFFEAYATAPYPNITASNANAAAGNFYVIATGVGSFQILNGTALIPTNPYILIYHVTG
jgi:hypothetical protein